MGAGSARVRAILLPQIRTQIESIWVTQNKISSIHQKAEKMTTMRGEDREGLMGHDWCKYTGQCSNGD